jgi:hypothetical protein
MRGFGLGLVAATLVGCFPETRALNEAERLQAEAAGMGYEEAFALSLDQSEWDCLLGVRVAIVDDVGDVCQGDGYVACYTTNRDIERRNHVIVLPQNAEDWMFLHEFTHHLLGCVEDDSDGDHASPAWAALGVLGT